MTLAHRDALLKMLARISFRLGEFKLSSGATSDYYIDCRTTTLTGEGGRLTGLAVLDLIRQHELHPRAVGGLTLGADPIVGNGAAASAWRALEPPGAAGGVGVICLVEREDAKGRPAVEAAGQGAPFYRLFSANALRAEHVSHFAL